MIVKTDLNYGGGPDRLLEPSLFDRRPRLDRVRRRLLGAAGLAPITSWQQYRVYERVEEVPALWFRRRDVVVERFLPELEDGLYHYRMYQFLGDRVRCTRIGSPRAVFKDDDSTSAEPVEPHPEAEAWRGELGADYGKIDYVVQDGRAFLLDLNKTTGATYRDPGTLDAERRHQAQGIYAYL